MVGPETLAIVGVVVVVLFGPKRLPELMRGIGQGLGEFRKGVDEAKYTMRQAIDAEIEKAKDPLPARSPEPEAQVAAPVVDSAPITEHSTSAEAPIHS